MQSGVRLTGAEAAEFLSTHIAKNERLVRKVALADVALMVKVVELCRLRVRLRAGA
jgi:hypothetical protein